MGLRSVESSTIERNPAKSLDVHVQRLHTLCIFCTRDRVAIGAVYNLRMTSCSDLRANAMALAALPGGDPEREPAFAHARTCADCAAALAEAGRLLTLVSETAPPAPAGEALARTSASLAADFRAQKRSAALLAGAATIVPLAAIALVRLPGRERQPYAWIATAVLAFVALVALGTLTRPRALANALAAVLVAAAANAASFLFADREPGFHAGAGLRHCAALELAVAVAPLAVTVWALRSGRIAGGPLALAAAAAAAALAGQGANALLCPHTALSHLLAFHAGAVLLAAAGGWLTSFAALSFRRA
jgi:hypothetical protein